MDIATVSSSLHLGDDGIWHSADKQLISYPSDGNENYFAVEEHSFWFRHRNNCIAAAVSMFPPLDNTIFDIGGGNGFVSLHLARQGINTVLVEPGPAGAANAKRRGISSVICATTETARFYPHALPSVGLFDVIEHISDDSSFLRSIHRITRPGGLLYATVPAFPQLWSEEDVLAGHYRRYTLASLTGALQAAQFTPIFASYIFQILPIPILLFRTLPTKLGIAKGATSKTAVARDHGAQGGLSKRIAELLLNHEIHLLMNRRSIPIGGSCLVVARAS